MKKYEVAFIIKPNVAEEEIKNNISKIKDIYESRECNIIDEFDMGMRKLAYDIEKNSTGYYYFMNILANSEANQEFERICRISEDIIRFMVINIDDVEGSTLDILRKETNK